MSVKILPRNHPREDAGRDYVRVSTVRDPFDETITLATIERVVKKLLSEDAAGVHVKTLLTRTPMSTDAAVGLAKSYATRKGIEVVYTDENDSG